MTPQENQPGEATPQNLVGPKPQAECHTPPNVGDGVKRYYAFGGYIIAPHGQTPLPFGSQEVILASDHDRVVHDWEIFHSLPTLDAERAKRLQLEGELAACRGNEFSGDPSKWSHKAQIGGPSAQLLALRGKVGLQDLGDHLNSADPHEEAELDGPEAKADGETRPTSEQCPICNKPIEQAFSRMDTQGREWCRHCGEDFDARDFDAEEGKAPSPDLRVGSRPVKAMKKHPCPFCYSYMFTLNNLAAHLHYKNCSEFRVALGEDREPPATSQAQPQSEKKLVGEGRKVSANAMDWLEEINRDAQEYVDRCWDAKHPDQKTWLQEAEEKLQFTGELLCVLSEEGGRQKEGQGDATRRPVDDASDLNPQNKSDL